MKKYTFIFIEIISITVFAWIVEVVNTQKFSDKNQIPTKEITTEEFTIILGDFIDSRVSIIYKYVKIGTRVWMVENLRDAKYNGSVKAVPYISCVDCRRKFSQL